MAEERDEPRERVETPRQAEDGTLDTVLKTLNDFYGRHGFLADEFSSL